MIFISLGLTLKIQKKLMCWPALISLMFALIHTFVAYRVLQRGRGYEREFLMFTSFYALTEFLQFFQWLVGVADPQQPCPMMNTILTAMAYILIWAQPLLFSLMGCLDTASNFNAGYYTFAIGLSMAIFAVALINLFAGFFTSSYQYLIVSPANFGQETCTYLGRYGYLDWQFHVRWLDFQPTYIIYLAIIIGSVILLDSRLRFILGLGWGGTFLLTFLLVGGSSEFPGSWTWFSVLADIPILIYTLLP